MSTHLQRLHAAQEEPSFRGLVARDLMTTGWERMYPEQENVRRSSAVSYGSVRAKRISRSWWRTVIVRNRINFNQPCAWVTGCGFRAVSPRRGPQRLVETDIERLGLDRQQTALSNTCVFTFVNVDETLTPRPVPVVIHDISGR